MDEMKKTRLAVLVALVIVMAVAGAPLEGRGAVDPCSATLSPDLRLTIPALYFEGNLYSVGLLITGTPAGLIETEITDMKASTQNCAMPAVLSIDTALVLQLPSVVFGADDYGFELEYDSTVAAAGDSGRQAAAVNSKILWKPKKAYRNKGVWRGSSTCKYNGTATIGGITSTQATTTYAAATFACAQPVPLGSFGCLTLVGTGTGDATAAWKLVSGSILYTLAGTQATGGSSCMVALDGQKTFPMKTPDLGDGLIMTLKETEPLFLYYSGSGRQGVPSYKVRQVTDCPDAGVHNEIVIDKADDFTDWLGFPAGLVAVYSGNATIITGSDVVVSSITTSEVTSSLTCSWNFSFIP